MSRRKSVQNKPIIPYIPRRLSVETEDVDIRFLYSPHSFSVLIIVLLVLGWLAFHPFDTVQNVKYGLLSSALIFVVFGMVQFKNGPFIRPHPVLWRCVLAVAIIYLQLLIFTLSQSKKDVMHMLKMYDPTLGVPLVERGYADSCDLTWTNVKRQMDIFVIAHALGWFFKALLLRDYFLCWVLSVSFELLEYSLEHQLPNFKECWWDHWILDVLLCNYLGILLGMKCCHYFELKGYEWRGISKIPTIRGKVYRSIQQFTPHSWTRFDWHFTENLRNYVGLILISAIVLLCELNAFYLKFVLHIPPEHPLNTQRLIWVYFMAVPAVREAYHYLSESQQRLGPNAWVMLAAITTELLIVIKFGDGMFPREFPLHVIVGWTIFVIAVVGYAIYKFILYDRFYAETDEKEINEDADKASQIESETDSNRELRQRRKPVSYKE